MKICLAIAINAALLLNANGEPTPQVAWCGGVKITTVKRLATTVAPRSGNFNIAVTYESNVTTAQRLVIQQAVNEWDAILQSRGVNPGSYPVNIGYASIPGSRVASTGVQLAAGTEELVSSNTDFDTDVTWFEDSTPANDSEFTGGSPPAGFDLLTVARHELGHALGWIASKRVTNLIASDVFDASRLNIGMAAGDAQHADPALHADDVMQPVIVVSVRRPIRLYPNGALLARAYQQAMSMHFVDPAAMGTQTGTATQPWQSLSAAGILTPVDVAILLAPQIHGVTANESFSTRHPIHSARGGATVRVP